PREKVLGRIHEGLRGRHPKDEHSSLAVVRRPFQQEVVPGPSRVEYNRGKAREARHGVSAALRRPEVYPNLATAAGRTRPARSLTSGQIPWHAALKCLLGI